MRHLLKTAILLTALLLLMATAAQAATTTPIVTYKKGGTTSYTLNFASAAGTGDALKDATDITATGTTLAENDLVVVDEVMECTARFFAGPAAYRCDKRIRDLARRLAEVAERGSAS